MPIKLKDNTQNQKISEFYQCADELIYLSAQTIGNLRDNSGSNILIFPHSFSKYGDDVDRQYVFSVNSRFVDGKNRTDSINTGNMMGFMGINGIDISISSRFSDGTDKDYFLMYLLKKVLSINVVSLEYGVTPDSIFELLVFMFPVFLRRAMRQGIFRQYKRNNYNDANIRGAVNISEHLNKNIPFNFRIAYSTREFDKDNHIMQLIRHTIEYIRYKKEYKHILVADRDTDRWVKDVVSMTPSYNARQRDQVIKDNIRPLHHPYYTEYYALQKLCLRILKHEKTGYGKSEDKIYGVLFDGAWLWEEYLANLLKPLSLKHPKNRIGEGRIYLCEKNRFPRFPDFYRDEDWDVVIDAKYKRNFDSHDDINQILTYMYRLKSRYGAFILPSNSKDDVRYDSFSILGYGGELGVFRLMIPSQKSTDNFKDYMAMIKDSEKMLLTNLCETITK